MTISGHKSRNVFERYNIVNDQDQREAALRIQHYQDSKDTTVRTVTPKQARVIQFRRAENQYAKALITMKDMNSSVTINEKGINPNLANPLILKVPGRGIEPRTRGFSVLCSTD